MKKPKATKPYPYQEEGIGLIEHFDGRALLADEVGLGKTPQVLWWRQRHYKNPNHTVVVTPASLKWNWEREIKKHVGLGSYVLEGRTPPKKFSFDPKKPIILNYDILGSPTDPQSWVMRLKMLEPGLVIMDEVQAISNVKAKRTKACRWLCKGVQHVLALSGTPLTNRPAELWSVLNIIDPKQWPTFFPYGFRYCGARRNPWGWDFSGASRLDELHDILLRSMMIRRRKIDVLKDLPAVIKSVVPMEIDNREEYDEALYNFLRWLRKRSRVRAERAEKAQELVKMGYLKQLAGSGKVDSVAAWVRDFLEEDKLLLFAVHKQVISKLEEIFRKECVVVDGSVVGHRRQMAFDKFNEDPKCRLLIGNIKAAGAGWSCTATSSVAFAEYGWTPGEIVQCVGRVHGTGRGVKGVGVNAYFLVGRDTIEDHLCQLIQRKMDTLDRTLDGSESRELDIHSLLIQQLEKAK